LILARGRGERAFCKEGEKRDSKAIRISCERAETNGKERRRDEKPSNTLPRK